MHTRKQLDFSSPFVMLFPAGYTFETKSPIHFTPILALGAGINVKESGTPIGPGAILLWGLEIRISL